ncbi:MAG: amidohydrolase [Clostridia bacterium]|nr:amidohydrolase [Clostridia bacterium]
MNENLNKLFTAIEKHRDLMWDAEKYIWEHPETGFKEWLTHAYLKEQMEKLGYTLHEAKDIPGFSAEIDTGKEGPTVVIMAEMDSIVNFSHPACNKETGAVHACGHHAQCASLLGAAAALKEEGVLSGLCGKIRILFEPAEELLEINYREELRRQGVIKYFGGKVEFMRRGFFDGADLCVMLHSGEGKNSFNLSPGQNGCIVKQIAYRGKTSHAAAPYKAVNALYAANVGIAATNALREVFRDEDHIRYHPIFTGKIGTVNNIPDLITMESYVRGASLPAMKQANKQINRALAGSAAAMGATVSLRDRPGYAPVDNDENIYNLSKQVMAAIVGEENVKESPRWGAGCTDMGDISCVFPAIHPHGSGYSGGGHGDDFYITDKESALTQAGKYLLGMCGALLCDNAAAAKHVLANKHTQFDSIESYLASLDELIADADAVEYTDEGAVLRF